MSADRSPDFAAFPRARLALKWKRRHVLTSLATELRIRSEQSNGGAAIKIPDLGLLPDEVLELMTPVLAPGLAVEEWDQPFALAVSLIDSQSTLRQISEQLERDLSWESDRAFRYTRGVFLHMVSLGICLPKR